MDSAFELQLKDDVKNIFLNGDFSVEAFYKPDSDNKLIRVQYFNESLDKMDTLYDHVWCSYDDLPTVAENDTLSIDGVLYGIIDSTPDEQNMGMNLFLSKVA